MRDLNTIWALWLSGFTRRWHMNPFLSGVDDYNCAHQGRCGLLVITLFPDHSIDLLRAAITHDAAEARVGDLSQPFKACGGDVVAAHAALEAQCLRDMGFDWKLTSLDKNRLRLVDLLDAWLFFSLRGGVDVHAPDWKEARAQVIGRASYLGVADQVIDLLADADRRVVP